MVRAEFLDGAGNLAEDENQEIKFEAHSPNPNPDPNWMKREIKFEAQVNRDIRSRLIRLGLKS